MSSKAKNDFARYDELRNRAAVSFEQHYAKMDDITEIKDDKYHDEALEEWIVDAQKLTGTIVREVLDAATAATSHNLYAEAVMLNLLARDIIETHGEQYTRWMTGSEPKDMLELLQKMSGMDAEEKERNATT